MARWLGRLRADLFTPLGLMALMANAIPIFGVVAMGWSLGALVILYWLENLIVGGVNLARMAATAAKDGPAGIGALAFVGPFFTAHYGIFCFVHGIFVIGLFGAAGNGLGAMPDGQGPEQFLPAIVSAFVRDTPLFLAALAAIIAFKLASFVGVYLLGGGYRRTNVMEQMMAPYGRIVFLHIAIFAGAFGLMLLGSPIAGVAILALAKTIYDVWAETREAKPAPAPAPDAAIPSQVRWRRE